jgi:hypothetical protein
MVGVHAPNAWADIEIDLKKDESFQEVVEHYSIITF